MGEKGPSDDLLTPEQLAALMAAGEGGQYESAFTTGFTPGTGPGGPVQGAKNVEHGLERNVWVGGLWVCTCICPHCGARFAHEGQLHDDEPDPPCWRCEVSVGVPLDQDEAAAMAEFRWRYNRFLEAIDVGGGKIGKTEEDMRHTFITACDSGMVYAPVMLKALERRYGDQSVRLTHLIATGQLMGVELK